MKEIYKQINIEGQSNEGIYLSGRNEHKKQ